MISPLASDLDELLTHTPGLWNELRGASVFLTGGTGFFGIWLIESLLHANHKLNLGVQVTVLSRNKTVFLARNPHLANIPELVFYRGDVRTFDFPSGGFTHIIHAATQASDKLNREQPALMKEVINQGTRRVLEMAKERGAKRFLYTSSGAVYGPRTSDSPPASEDDPGAFAPLTTPSAYAEGKREAERLCIEAAQDGLALTIARGFAFTGPHLPLDQHFAIGNFIQDALRGGPIVIRGDGTPLRSYLYASDLAIWLWTILLKGKPGRTYNVGSERRVNVVQLAQIVAKEVASGVVVKLMQSPSNGKSTEQYTPSTARARGELGLKENVSLEEAIRRTAIWACRQVAKI